MKNETTNTFNIKISFFEMKNETINTFNIVLLIFNFARC